jgi:hypothetical protein
LRLSGEAASEPSFTIHHGASNLFSGEAVRAIVFSVIANFIYQHTLAPKAGVTVNVGATEVVIQQGDTRIVVPRYVHDATPVVARSPLFLRGIESTVRAVEADPDIQSIGFSTDLGQPAPVPIPRQDFIALPSSLSGNDPDTRDLVEITDIEILRAILDRSRRRWQFVWNGMKIPAPVLDDRFYNEFFAHRITIAPGDRLRVRLRVRQRRSPDVKIYINEAYEVLEVLQHIPRGRQATLGERP